LPTRAQLGAFGCTVNSTRIPIPADYGTRMFLIADAATSESNSRVH
jgi:hypothetical protein